MRFYIPYFIVTYAIALIVPANLRFAAVIMLIIVGYCRVNAYFVRYFMAEFVAGSGEVTLGEHISLPARSNPL